MATIKDEYLNPIIELYDVRDNFISKITNNDDIRKNAFSIKKRKKINEITMLTFKMPFDNGEVGIGSNENKLKMDGEWYIIKSVTLSSYDIRVLEIEAEADFTICKSILCEPMEIIGVTPEEMFAGIMDAIPENTLGYKFLGSDIETCRSLVETEEISVFEALLKMAEAFNGVLELTYGDKGSRFVYLRGNPLDSGKVVEKDSELKTLNITYDTSGIFTRLLPLGAVDSNGIELNIIDVNPTGKSYIENYGYYKELGASIDDIERFPQFQSMCVIKYSDIVEEQDLYDKAVEELTKKCQPRISGSVGLCDMSLVEGTDVTEPRIFESITISDEDIGLTYKTNITEIEYDYDNILETKITLDNIVDYNSIIKDLVTSAGKIDGVINVDKDGVTLIGSLIKGNLDANIVHIGGMLSDTADIAKTETTILFECRDSTVEDLYGAVAIGCRGILISDELNSDGSWNWKTAISAKSVNAELLSAFTIMGETIIGGVIQDVLKSTWINLETGEFNFKDRVKYIDGKFSITLGSGGSLDDFKDEYDENKNAIQKDIADINQKLKDIEVDIGGVIADGIIDEAETLIIKESIRQLNKEKSDIDSRYTAMYANINLLDPAKSNLKYAYDDYVSKHNALINQIEDMIEDKVATELEKLDFNRKILDYDKALSLLSVRLDEAIDNIAHNDTKTQLDEMKSVIDKDIENVTNSVDELESVMNGAFKDGIISETELKLIKEKILVLETEKTDIDKNYNNLINNSYLKGNPKSELQNKYSTFVREHNELIALIDSVVADNLSSAEEITAINNKLKIYYATLSEYSVAQNNALSDIANNLANENINSLRDEVQADINDVNNRIDNVIEDVGGAIADGIISEAETIIIANSIAQLNKEKEDVVARYNYVYSNSNLSGAPKQSLKNSYDDYIYRHNDLVSYINEMISDKVVNPTEKSEYEDKIRGYSISLSILSKAFDVALSNIAENNANALTEALRKELMSNINDVSEVANKLKDDLQGYTADGILTSAEKDSIRSNLRVLATEKKDIDNEYATLYNNKDLVGTPKSALKIAYDGYARGYANLIDIINTILGLDNIESSHTSTLETRFTEHDNALGAYSIKVNDAIDSIADRKIDIRIVDLKNELSADISNVSNSLNDLEEAMNGAFKDGIIDEAEMILIKDKIIILNAEKNDIDKNYNNLYSNFYLRDNPKTELNLKHTAYSSAHDTLIRTINSAIYDGAITDAELESIKTNTTAYNTTLSDYNVAQSNAVNNISFNKTNDDISKLKTDVDKDISDVTNSVNDLANSLDGAFKDGIISEAELKIIEQSIKQLDKEKVDVDMRYVLLYNNPSLK